MVREFDVTPSAHPSRALPAVHPGKGARGGNACSVPSRSGRARKAQGEAGDKLVFPAGALFLWGFNPCMSQLRGLPCAGEDWGPVHADEYGERRPRAFTDEGNSGALFLDPWPACHLGRRLMWGHELQNDSPAGPPRAGLV